MDARVLGMPALVLATLLHVGSAAARASDAPAVERLGGFKGQCRSLLVAGKPAKCASKGGVVYIHLRNNRTIWMIGLADGKSAVAFIGDNDHQGIRDGAVLPLSRVRAGADPESPPVPVSGECRYSQNGTRPGDLRCEARDDEGRMFSVDFVGDGSPFDLKRF